MSRQKKKRNKPYTGADAAPSQPVVHHYTAVVRSPLSQWWFDNKKRVKIISYIVGGVLGFGYLLYEFFRMVF
ncbi:MAG TPA: hypothetical protein VLA88_00425 [Candidatus Saccharimonadales bacterium]|nr:hypothetical protein [Candidatus Saccharimonadales bacterium]